jgi:glycosyltransferase involved in cell wall biosynthesis
MELTYALVTPARNEAENLRRLADCLVRQTKQPAMWVVVDDGSTDETHLVGEELAREHDWIAVIDSPGPATLDGPLGAGRRTGRDVIAFKAGLDSLRRAPSIAVKLDADVSFADDYFERLLAEFVSDPGLGIAGGVCLELERGEWRPQHQARSHVRGATRAYRWECLQDVSPLVERLGWDGIDETTAVLKGWGARNIDDLFFFHHRKLGQRDGARRAWEQQGEICWFLGYRFSYVLLKTLFRARKDRMALAMLRGFLAAAWRREPRYEDADVRRYIRAQQSVAQLPRRAREALGRR